MRWFVVDLGAIEFLVFHELFLFIPYGSFLNAFVFFVGFVILFFVFEFHFFEFFLRLNTLFDIPEGNANDQVRNDERDACFLQNHDECVVIVHYI